MRRKLWPYAALEYLAKCCRLLTRCACGKLLLLGSGSSVGSDAVWHVVVSVDRIVCIEVVWRTLRLGGTGGGGGGGDVGVCCREGPVWTAVERSVDVSPCETDGRLAEDGRAESGRSSK